MLFAHHFIEQRTIPYQACFKVNPLFVNSCLPNISVLFCVLTFTNCLMSLFEVFAPCLLGERKKKI